LNDQTEVLVEE